MKKKLATLLIIAAICTSAVPVFATETIVTGSADVVSVTEPTAIKSQTFTIDNAMEYAKENSRSIAAVKAAEATAKAQKEETKKASKDTRDMIFKTDTGASSDSTYLVLTGYTYRATVFNYAVSQRTTLMQEYTLESQVKSAFYTYISYEKAADIAKSALNSAKSRLTHAELKYQMGSISQIELEQFRMAVIEAQNSYNSAIRTKELGMIKLKSTLNYPQADELYVIGSMESPVMDTTTPDEAFVKSEKSISMVNAKESLELAKFKLDRGVAHYTSNTLGARSIKAEYAQAELNYYNTVDNQRINIYSAYNDMAKAYESLDYLRKSIEILEKSLEASKRSFELGLTTAEEYLDTVQSYDTLKNQLSSAELGAYLATVNYKLQYDCENTIIQEDPSL